MTRRARHDHGVRLAKLPGRVIDDAASVREEMAPYVKASPEELWRHTEDCARDAGRAIADVLTLAR